METSDPTTLWLDTIRFELDALTEDQIVPLDHQPVQDNEKLIGHVTADLHKRLFTLSRLYSYKAAQLDLERRYGTKAAAPADDGELAKWGARAQLLGLMFWTEVRSTLPNYGSDEVGLRDNWQLVEGPPSPPGRHIIGKILGLEE